MPGSGAPSQPTRIVLQTKTHLVPGSGYQERCENMRDLLCQHLWQRHFLPGPDRWHVYRAAFAYDGQPCYFLLDHGQSASNDVPVLWYKWTGKAFILVRSSLPREMRAKLERYPFVRPKRQPLRGSLSQSVDAATRRQMIRHRLRSDMKIPVVEAEFLRDPEQAALLKQEVDPKFWDKIDALTQHGRCQAEIDF
ncbi:hypothetical protein F4802DRAFT_596995 [Xylaria palmicola]|nr:hypothetical protein F4802DRAFT_596995 [Xylaria palmicola]